MVRCWYIREHSFEERSGENFERENETISLEQLTAATGASCLHLDADKYQAEGKLEQIRTERGYKYSDELIVNEAAMGADFLNRQRGFFNEHLHEDEEIRFVLEGEGYFDLRDAQSDKYIRVLVEKGDLLIVPSGCYHRFALTGKQGIHLLRLFLNKAEWNAVFRTDGTDSHPSRLAYLANSKTW